MQSIHTTNSAPVVPSSPNPLEVDCPIVRTPLDLSFERPERPTGEPIFGGHLLYNPLRWTALVQERLVEPYLAAALDCERGGFFTSLSHELQPNPAADKFCMPLSRFIYGFAVMYDLTGERRYLDAARRGVDFLLTKHLHRLASDEAYFVQQLSRAGEARPAELLTINEQSYGLTGLIQYYRINREPQILEAIRSGHNFLNRFSDPIHGGFYEQIDSKSFAPVGSTKSYNSTVYPATSALLELESITEGQWREAVLKQILELAGIFADHFPDPQTGFIIERFSRDWREDWSGSWQSQVDDGAPITVGIVGHNIQGAYFLLRAADLLEREGRISIVQAESWRKTAKKLFDSMLRVGCTAEGAFLNCLQREPSASGQHRDLFKNLAFWQQHEGVLAACELAWDLRMQGSPEAARYAQAAADTLAFWQHSFVDYDHGGEHNEVRLDGAPLVGDKVGPGKSLYHAVEALYLTGLLRQRKL